MSSRRVPGALVSIALVLVCALASCSSSGGTKSGRSSAPKSTATSSAAPGKSTDATALIKKLQSGIASITTAHFTIASKIAGQAVTGAGDQSVKDGKLVALDATAALPGGLGDVELRVVGGVDYGRLPKGLSTSGKLWTLITPKSSNPVVTQLATFIDTALTAASIGNLDDVAGATTGARDLGPQTIAGTPTTHYVITVDPTKLPAELSARAGLGTAPIPADLYADATGRPIQIRVALSISGSSTDTTIGFSRFGAPVAITAPPAALVGNN